MRHSRRLVSWCDTWDIVTRTRSHIDVRSAATRRWNSASWDDTSGRTRANALTSVRTARTPAPTRTNSNDIREFTPARNRTNVTSVTSDSRRAIVSRCASSFAFTSETLGTTSRHWSCSHIPKLTVNRHWARLVLGWVTVSGRVNHLSTVCKKSPRSALTSETLGTTSIITLLNKSSVWCHVRAAVSADVWNRVVYIWELLFITCHFYTLELFTHSEIDTIVNCMCMV